MTLPWPTSPTGSGTQELGPAKEGKESGLAGGARFLGGDRAGDRVTLDPPQRLGGEEPRPGPHVLPGSWEKGEEPGPRQPEPQALPG